MRIDHRAVNQLREIKIVRGFTQTPAGSVLISAGQTMILCTASISEDLPGWIPADDTRGWITAEYNMIPGSTSKRKARDRDGHTDSRSVEIQRLIGRSLRGVVDRQALGRRLITVDCEVLQADGGTRTLAITGSLIALVDALATLPPFEVYPLLDSITAVSVGYVSGQLLLDLCYAEDSRADVDMNFVLTGGGSIVECQGTAEGRVFTQEQFNQMYELASQGCEKLRSLQKASLGSLWPFD